MKQCIYSDIPVLLLGLLGGLLGAFFFQLNSPVINGVLSQPAATIDTTLLLYHREAVATLMEERKPRQVAARYREQLPAQLAIEPETQSLLIFDRMAVLGGVNDLTGVMAEKYSQLMDTNKQQKEMTP